MSNREKVIEDFEKLREYANGKVHPVISPDNWNIYSKLRDLIDEAEEDVLALLKAQEQNPISTSGLIHWLACENCQAPINPEDKFCHECGQAVKWGD